MFGFLKKLSANRRNEAIEGRIKKMVSSGKDYAVFDELYFEAARTYAIEKGAKAADSTSASASVLVGGTTYRVMFVRATSGGTIFGVEDAQDVKDRVLDPSKWKEFLDKN